MKNVNALVTAIALVLLLTAAGLASAASVSKDDAAAWIRYTVPLPKSIEIPEMVSVARGSVAIVGPAQKDQVSEQAAKELTEAIGGCATSKAAFTLNLAIGGTDAEPLKALKNSNQAYRIIPAGKTELKLVALTSNGLYYAVKTLQQLINGRATDSTIQMPLVTVTDWPDLEERGLWGSDNFDHLRWMADRKMNLVEQICAHSVDKDGTIKTGLKAGREPMVTEGPLYGINPVPVVLHLEQSIGGRGAYTAYPYLRGKSEHGGVACYSQPKTTEIIAEWIAGLSKLPNVTDVDVWMSENLQGHKGCQCDLCKATGVDPVVLEARAIVNAWKMAEQIAGKKIGLRTLTSEATEEFNTQIFAELPPEVKVIYYHSLLTYTSGRAPMMWRPYLEEFAKSGRWLGVCPSMSAHSPFSSASFMHYRCKEFVDKGLACIMGYATPRVHFTFFNVDAAAEYSWNVNGRSTREFAASYAVRNGIKDPEKFAEYAENVGAVQWDYIGSDWPMRADSALMQEPINLRLKKGTVPDLGFVLWDFIRVPFGNVSNVRQLYGNVDRAKRAVRLAKEMGIEEYIQESRATYGFTISQRALYDLRRVVRDGRIAGQHKDAARRYFREYVGGLREACDALPKWEATVQRPTDPRGFTEPTVQFITERVINPMIETARELGVEIK